MQKISIFIACLLLSGTGILSQPLLPYKNPDLPVDERVKDLVARMTPEEKFWQLFMISGEVEKGKEVNYRNGIFGFQVSAKSQGGDAAGQLLAYSASENALTLLKKINGMQKYFVEQTRLGIPIIPFDEALHGLVREGATAYPQAIALAATWDTALVSRISSAIAKETRMRGIRQILTPVVNIASDVRWGRTEETYGEDPFLSAAMGVAFVKPFEKAGIITTPKHFLANVGDGGRDSYPIHFNERLLEEIFLPPFEACFNEGGSRSVMTSYNSLDGSPATANNWLLNKKLKGEMKFGGFVISDASAVGGANVLHFTAKDYAEAGKQAITNGLDVIFQTDYAHHKLFIPPFLDGSIPGARIDDAVSRVLKAKFELGLFEDPITPEEGVAAGNETASKDLAREAAIKSIVLLKNETDLLPITGKVRSIAVFGSDATEGRLGGYSGPGNGTINILEGIKERAGSAVQISYAPGPGRQPEEWALIPAARLSTHTNGRKEPGLRGEYFNNISLSGQPVLTRTDATVNFHWTLFPPDSAVTADFYSVRWTGFLESPGSGNFRIGMEGNDGFRLYINDRLLIDRWEKQSFSTELVNFPFRKGMAYPIRIEFREPNGNAHVKLIWTAGADTSWRQKITQAVALAKKADIAIVAAGIREGEFQDRAMLSLPGHQEELINSLAGTGKPVVVLLVGGSAVTMQDWIKNARAIVNVWYPGEEGGRAVAAVLFGDVSPAGRLPITYPLSEAQLPLVYNHKPTGRGDDYNNLSGLPLFPFGFGLSYSSFKYEGLLLDKKTIAAGDSAKLQFSLTNTGTREADEVVQLYIRDMLASVARPVMELKGFQRVRLSPGQTKQLTFMITPGMLTMLDQKLAKVIEPGEFRLMIGASSRDLRLKETLTVRK